jgi:uncharacterized membrane protein AbrB (regulator of aidB expression)
MASDAAKPWLRTMWRVNLAVLLVFVVCMVTVDMNGDYPFLPSWASLLLTLAVLGCGVGMNGYLTVADEKRRFLAGICLVLFILASLPLIL